MSGVDSTGRSQDDAIRRARETYQSQENESTKKHKQEVRALTEAHQAEIEKIKASHQSEMEQLKSKSREAFTRRDMQYQQEIDDLREMHQKQLVRSAQEAEDKQSRNVGSVQRDAEKYRVINEKQRADLKKHYDEAMADKDRQFDQYTQQQRDAMQVSNEETRRRLTRAHQKELGVVVDERNDRVQEMGNSFQQLRRAKDEQIANERQGHGAQVERLRTNFEDVLQDQRDTNQMREQSQRQSFQAGLQANQDRYNRALEEKTESMNEARRELTDNANSRINNRLRAIESDYHRLKSDYSRASMAADMKKKREIDDMRYEYTANLDLAEKNRRATLEEANKKTHGEIGQVNKKNEELMLSRDRFYQDKMGMDQLRNEERFMKSQTDHEKILSHANSSNEARLNKLKNFNELEGQRQRAYFDGTIVAQKEGFEEKLQEMRVRNQEEQQKLFASFTKQAKENDEKLQKKMDEMGLRYEKQIADLGEKHDAEMKDLNKQWERRLTEVQKKADLDLKTQGSQYEYRLSKTDEVHKREIQDMNRKQEEAILNITKVKKA